jgi:hypothetical protein
MMTIREAKQILKPLGMTLSKRDGEYRVNFRSGGEGPAYYTDCLIDAVETAQAMHRRAQDVK